MVKTSHVSKAKLARFNSDDINELIGYPPVKMSTKVRQLQLNKVAQTRKSKVKRSPISKATRLPIPKVKVKQSPIKTSKQKESSKRTLRGKQSPIKTSTIEKNKSIKKTPHTLIKS